MKAIKFILQKLKSFILYEERSKDRVHHICDDLESTD